MGKKALNVRLKPADVQMVIWESPTAAAAARALNVHESSVSRWLNTGKFTRRRPLQARPHGSAPRPESGTPWPDQIRRDYALSPEHDRALTLAARAWSRANNDQLSAADQDRATKLYCDLMQVLGVEDAKTAAADQANAPVAFPRRA